METGPTKIEINEVTNLTELAAALGLEETPGIEIEALRNRIVESIKNGKLDVGAYRTYEDNAMQSIDYDSGIPKPSVERAKQQIALLLLKAQMFYDGGDQDGYEYHINDALEYARHVPEIEAAILNLQLPPLK